MSEDILVNIQFQGINQGTFTQIQVTPSDIAWEDLELMLKVYADEEQLVIKYMDEEGDEIIIGSEEELKEAFKVAKRSNNTLSLRAVCNTPPAGLMDTNSAEFQEAVAASLEEIPSGGDPKGREMDHKTDCGVDSKDTDDVILGTKETADPDQAAEEMVDVKESGATKVDPIVAEDQTRKKENKRKPKPTPRKCHLFFIEKQSDNLVLDVKDGDLNPGAEVILSHAKSPSDPTINNQLWYFDKETKTIRSVLTDFCVDGESSGDEDRICHMMPYSENSWSQQWIWSDGHLLSGSGKPLILSTKLGAKCGTPLEVRMIVDTEFGHLWNLIPVEGKKHGFSRDAEEHIDKSFRPKPYKRSKRDHHPELSVSHRRIAATSQDPKVKSTRQRFTGSVVNDPEDQPPSWFFSYMDKFKEELRDDLAKLVARRTVHQVLKGLNNAMIDTVRITDGGHVPTQPASASPDGASGSEDAIPMYCHVGVVCDRCDFPIVGVRYKCGNCENFDLCENCETLDGSHDPDHVFLKIRRPIPVIIRKKNGHVVPLLKANLYALRDEKYAVEDHYTKKGDKLKRRKDKLLKKFEEFEEKMRRKEEKLKRHLDAVKELPKKKEKLDLPPLEDISMIDLKFIRHENLPDGAHVQPGTRFVKKWVVKNTGILSWNREYMLTVIDGSLSTVKSSIAVPHLKLEEEGVVSVVLIAPNEPGDYQSYWRLHHNDQFYGHHVSCSVFVDQKETLEPTADKADVLKVADNLQEDEEDSAVNLAHSTSELALEEAGVDDNNELTKLMASYETLTINGHIHAKASQTATPNNTPRDITPPKSPLPEIHILSNSSSVEIVTVDVDNDDDNDIVGDDAVMNMTDLVQERMANLGLKQSDDLDMWSSCEEFQTDDSDSDFYVVPIPDCFNLDLPPTTSASTSIIIKKDECRSIDEMLTTSHSLEMQPVLMPTSSQLSSSEKCVAVIPAGDEAETEVTAQSEQDCQTEGETAQLGASKEMEEIPQREQEQISEQNTQREQKDQTEHKNKVEQDNQENRTDHIEDDQSIAKLDPADEATTPKVVEVCDDSTTDGTDGQVPEVERHEVDDGDDQATDQNANLPLDINENSAGTPNQEEPSAAAAGSEVPTQRTDAYDPRALTPGPGEFAAHWVTAAQGVASIATMAAHSAYSTARDVFRTLQYVPPTSNWTPPQNTWTPRPAVPAPENLPQSLVDQLVEMGFANRELNQQLLDKHNNDLDKVVQDLVQEHDNEWSANRH